MTTGADTDNDDTYVSAVDSDHMLTLTTSAPLQQQQIQQVPLVVSIADLGSSCSAYLGLMTKQGKKSALRFTETRISEQRVLHEECLVLTIQAETITSIVA